MKIIESRQQPKRKEEEIRGQYKIREVRERQTDIERQRQGERERERTGRTRRDRDRERDGWERSFTRRVKQMEEHIPFPDDEESARGQAQVCGHTGLSKSVVWTSSGLPPTPGLQVAPWNSLPQEAEHTSQEVAQCLLCLPCPGLRPFSLSSRPPVQQG